MATHAAPAPPTVPLADRIAGASDRGLSYLASCRGVLPPRLLAAVDAEAERRAAAAENPAEVNGARRQEPREELPIGARPTDRPYVQRPGVVVTPRDETPAAFRPFTDAPDSMLRVIRDDARFTAERRAAAAAELARRGGGR